MFFLLEKRLEEDIGAPHLTLQLSKAMLLCLPVALSFYSLFVEVFRHRSVVR